MKKLLFSLLLFSLLFSTCSLHFEDEDTEEESQYTNQLAMELVFAAIAVTVVFTSLAYMASRFTNSAELLLFSKDSLTQLMVTVLMVVLIFTFLEGTCQFTKLFLGMGADTDPLQYSFIYMNQLKGTGSLIISSLYADSIQEKFEGAYLVGYFAPFVGGETGFSGAYHNANSRQDEILIDLVMAGFVSAGVQYFLIQMIRDFVFPVLIPFGLLLRALPLMREPGNIILAIGFTLLVVVPFAYCINAFAAGYSATSIPTEDASVASYLLQTIFLPNLALVVTITAATAMIKVAKVIP